MKELVLGLLRMLIAAIHAAVWLASVLTILVYIATTLSQSKPEAGRALSIIPEASSFDGADSFADVEAPYIAQREASGSEQVIPGLTTGSITIAMFWDRAANLWSQPAGLSQGDAGYSAGEIVPSLLVVRDLAPGTVYQVWLDYSGCTTPHSLGFDFLGSSPRGDAAPDLVTSGPGRSLPDARILMPADTSQALGVFDLWGATFLSAPLGPFPSLTCSQNKLVILRVLARSDTIFLLWGSHVAGSGLDPEVISHDLNPAPTNAAAEPITISPVTATVRQDLQGNSSPAGQD